MASLRTEFSAPSACSTAFCQRISSEEFENQAAETTESELDSLMKYLENNPKIYYEMLRRKKSDSLGLLESLKVKVMTALQGDEYLENYFPENDCEAQLEVLKGEMVSTYDYGQEAKGSKRRFSKRLANKRKAALQPNCSRNNSNAPPPPPPPPPVVTKNCTQTVETKENRPPKKKIAKGNSKSHLEEPLDLNDTVSGTFKSRNSNLLQSIRGVSARKRIRAEETLLNMETDETIPTEIMPDKENSGTSNLTKKKGLKKSISRTFSKTSVNLKNLQEEISNAKKKLRCVGGGSSPTSTPYQASKERRMQQQPDAQFPFFNQALVDKFKNARSPTVSPSGAFNDSGFNSPSD